MVLRRGRLPIRPPRAEVSEHYSVLLALAVWIRAGTPGWPEVLPPLLARLNLRPVPGTSDHEYKWWSRRRRDHHDYLGSSKTLYFSS